MKRPFALILFALLAAPLIAADPPKTIPRTDGATIPAPVFTPFKFPLPLSPAADPPTPPAPGAAIVLPADTAYIIPHDEPFLLFASPAPLVKITRETGPFKFRGKFLDSKGKIETRTITAKFVAIVEAATDADGKPLSGRAELIAIPDGTKDEAKAERQWVAVGDLDPLPPPKPLPPPVPPEPKPDPKPNPAGPLWLVIVYENDTITPATAKVLQNSAFWEKQRKAGNQFKPFDQNEPNAVKLGYVRAATQDRTDAAGKVTRKAPGLPALIVVDADGDVIRAVQLPTVEGIDALVKEVNP